MHPSDSRATPGAVPAPQAPQAPPPVSPPSPPAPTPPAPGTGPSRGIYGEGASAFDTPRRTVPQSAEAAEQVRINPTRYRQDVFDALMGVMSAEPGNIVPVQLGYRSVKTAGSPPTPGDRFREREAAYVAEAMANGGVPADVRAKVEKVTIPYRFEVRDDNVNVNAMSPDKVVANAHRLAQLLQKAGPEATRLFPYPIGRDGKITPDGWRALVRDTIAYTQNHANGYAGDGSTITQPPGYHGGLNQVNPGYTPVRVGLEQAYAVNLLMGIAPPQTSKAPKGMAGAPVTSYPNVQAGMLAEANQRFVVRPAPTARPGQSVYGAKTKAGPQIPIAETNPIRAALAKAGVDLSGKEGLHRVTEELSLEEIESVVPVPTNPFRAPNTPAMTASFMPEPRADDRTSGIAFKGFFSDVTKGAEKYRPQAPWRSLIPLEEQADFVAEYDKHTGNFDAHIATSIPGYKDIQVRAGDALVEILPPGSRVLDVGASEGSWLKTVVAQSDGKITGVALDPNPDMAAFFREKSVVPGAEYAEEAFLAGFEDGGRVYAAHNPGEAGLYDAVHEAMVFQFISPDRVSQVAEARRLMKPDGIFITDEKVLSEDPSVWKANEVKKDREWKNQFYSEAALQAKQAVVKFAQDPKDTKAVGMVDNMVTGPELERVLRDNFAHVVQYWDSGNFRGYAASNDAARLQAFVDAAGDTRTAFSTQPTPRPVVGLEARFMPGEGEPIAGDFDTAARNIERVWFMPAADPTLNEPAGPRYRPPAGYRARESWEPATAAGRALDDQGFELLFVESDLLPNEDGTLPNRSAANLVLLNGRGEAVGGVSTTKRAPDVIYVENTWLWEKLRGRGLGEALYRELGAFAQTEGVTRLEGDVVGIGAAATRRKVFGDKAKSVEIGGPLKSKSLTEVIAAMQTAPAIPSKSEARPVYTDRAFSITSRIDPRARFMPESAEDDVRPGEHWLDAMKRRKVEELEKLRDWGVTSPDEVDSNVVDPEDVASKLQRVDGYTGGVDYDGQGYFIFRDGTMLDTDRGHGEILERMGLDYDVTEVLEKSGVLRAQPTSVGTLVWEGAGEPTMGQRRTLQRLQDGGLDVRRDATTSTIGHRFMPTMAEMEAKWERAAKRKGGLNVRAKQAETKYPKTGWILPDGKYEGLAAATANVGDWHGNWLTQNRDRLAEMGIDVGEGGQTAREAAIDAGLIRVRNDANRGALTIEGTVEAIRKQRGTLEKMLAENIDSADWLRVNQKNKGGEWSATEVDLRQSEDRMGDALAALRPNRSRYMPGLDSGTPPAQGEPVHELGFETKARAIREGKDFGATFNPDGTEYVPTEPVDIVTLTNTNIPVSELTGERLQRFVGLHDTALGTPGTVVGAFRLEGQDGMVSLDLNVAVPKRFRKNTLAFAKENGQESIYDMEAGEVVPAGGDSKPRLRADWDLREAAQKLTKGEAFDWKGWSERTARARSGYRRSGGWSRKGSSGDRFMPNPEKRVSAALQTGAPKNRITALADRVSFSDVLDQLPNHPNLEKYVQKSLDIVESQPGFARPKGIAESDYRGRYEAARDQLAKNLVHLWDATDPVKREVWRKWYDLANELAERLAKEHNISMEAASGMNAALSPQKDWNENVSSTFLVLDALRRDPAFTQAHRDFTQQILSNRNEKTPAGARAKAEALAKLAAIKEGTRLSELPNEEASWLARAENELYADQRVRDHTGALVPNPGVRKVRWTSYSAVEKAISIYRDQSLENISNQVGEAHKVRNFYNNHVDPMNPNDVTMDTHAVGAAFLQAVGGSDEIVGHNFGSAVGSPEARSAGYSGIFSLLADAYREAAKQRDALPREMQSVTWEAVREIFPAAIKRGPLKETILNIHRAVERGELSEADGRRYIVATGRAMAAKAPHTIPVEARKYMPSRKGGKQQEQLALDEN